MTASIVTNRKNCNRSPGSSRVGAGHGCGGAAGGSGDRSGCGGCGRGSISIGIRIILHQNKLWYSPSYSH